MKDESFFIKLREDMLQTRQRRFQYQISKVTSIGSLIGIACLLVDKLNISIFFYVIPFIAIAFDLYVLSESFTLRRMAIFVRNFKSKSKIEDAELEWEKFVENYPDTFSSIANFAITFLCAISSVIILLSNAPKISSWSLKVLNIIWFLILMSSLSLVKLIEWKKVSHKAWINNTSDSSQEAERSH